MTTEMLAIFLLVVLPVGGEICTSRCYPGNDCFPGVEELVLFNNTIKGAVMFPTDEAYHREIILHNIYYTKFPAVVVFVSSTEDVRKSVLFARKYNLRVTIRSSGHDYIGRSTGHGSFQINLSRMRKTEIDLSSSLNPAGTIMIQSGAPWVEVYRELDKYDRVVVGGSAHTVSQGGYTQGGGHSPICRSLGLAVDQVLEMTVVTSDGRIVTANAVELSIKEIDDTVTITNDTDLFWALRGGGGGTFGIVTSYKYKLHYQPKQIVVASVGYFLSYNGDPSVGKEVMNFYNDFVKNMPNEWGGYTLMSNTPFETIGGYGTGVLFYFNHFGEWSLPSRGYINRFATFHPEWRILPLTIRNVSSFWEYTQNTTDAEYYSTYLMNTFIQNKNLNSDFANFIANTMVKPITDDNPGIACTGTHIGGKVSDGNPDDAPIHPGFRSGLISMSCGLQITPARFHFSEEKGMEFYNKLKAYGDGVYVNEPSANLTDWKEQFWGPHYERLLRIKQKWDKDNYFTCLHCVGSGPKPEPSTTESTSQISYKATTISIGSPQLGRHFSLLTLSVFVLLTLNIVYCIA